MGEINQENNSKLEPEAIAKMPEKATQEKPNIFENEPQERRILLQIAQDFLLDEKITEDILRLENRELAQFIQEKFQENLEKYFVESGLSDEIELLAEREKMNPSGIPLDEQALNLIANKSKGTNGWIGDMPSNIRKQYKDSGMNCTIASSTLHMALEKLGYSEVRTVLLKGHHVVFRQLDNRSIKLYDPVSLFTVDEQTVGYSRTFTPNEIKENKDVNEGGSKKGNAITIEIGKEDKIIGFQELNENGKYEQKFYAYDPGTKLDIAVVLENLSEIKDDAKKIGTPDSKPFNQEAYKEGLIDFLKQNNVRELRDEDLKEIEQENRDTIERLVKSAEKSFNGETLPPNPFDFLQSELLSPKADVKNIPDPKQFIGSSQRYEEAKELCEKYPELKQLDFKTTKEKFGLFDGYDYVK